MRARHRRAAGAPLSRPLSNPTCNSLSNDRIIDVLQRVAEVDADTATVSTATHAGHPLPPWRERLSSLSMVSTMENRRHASAVVHVAGDLPLHPAAPSAPPSWGGSAGGSKGDVSPVAEIEPSCTSDAPAPAQAQAQAPAPGVGTAISVSSLSLHASASGGQEPHAGDAAGRCPSAAPSTGTGDASIADLASSVTLSSGGQPWTSWSLYTPASTARNRGATDPVGRMLQNV